MVGFVGMLSILKRNVPVIILFVFFLSLYVYTAAPGVYDGDSGEIAAAVNELGLAHPTGFPLYMLTGKLFTLLVPIKDVAYRLNIFSSLLTAGSVVLLFFVLRTLKINTPVSFLSSIVFGLGSSVWFHAGIVAVYPMSIFFITLLLLIFAKWRDNQQISYVYWYAFIWGISLGTHSLMAILISPLLMMLWTHRIELRTIKTPIKLVVLFLVPFIQYLYIPIAYARNTLLTFGSVGTFKEFLFYITQRDYVFKIGVRGFDDVNLFITAAMDTLANEYGIIFFLLGLTGLVILAKSERRLFAIFAGMLLINLIMMFSYGPKGSFVLLSRYLYPSYIVLAIALASSIDRIGKRLTRHGSLFALAFQGLLVVAIVFLFQTNFAQNNRRDNYIVSDFSQNILQTVGKNSILISEGDATTGPLWYFRSIGQRDDIIHLDANMLMIDWHIKNINKHYPNVVDMDLVNIEGVNRDTRRMGRILALIEKNIDTHNIYLAMGINQGVLPEKYVLFPMGVVYQIFVKEDFISKEALQTSDELWNTYNMRNVAKSERYSFQTNAIVNFYSTMLNNIGIVYFSNQNPQSALLYFEKAIAVDPNHATAKNNLDAMKKHLNK